MWCDVMWCHIMSCDVMWCLSACLPVCLSACLPLCLSVCLHVGLCVCMCVCMCACVSVCMHVCMCVCTVCRVAWHGMAWHWMAWNALWWYCSIWHGMVWQGSVVLWQFESHRLEPTKTFKKSSFRLSPKSSQSLRLLGQLFLCIQKIHVDHHWNFHQKITVARILGHGEEAPELLRPFLGAGKRVKLRQIRQNSEIVVFLSIVIFCYCFRFLSVFLVFESNLTIQKLQKTCFFSRFFWAFFFLDFFSNYFRTEKTFSIYFRIICQSQIRFSIYFRIKNKIEFILRTWSTFGFVFAITGAIAAVIFATLAKFVATS